MKKVEVILSPQAREVFEYLNEQAANSKMERIMLRAILQKVDLIKINRTYGDPINKKLIPKEYVKRYGINNLFRIELPNFWRMLYTLKTEENQIEIIAFVLDILNHKSYNRLFGYN
jgi:hypothetical protein